MKIGMILDKTFPPDSRVENEAVSLIADGHEVYLFCLKYGDEKDEENYNGIKLRRYRSTKLEYKLSALAYTFPFYHLYMTPKIHDFIDKNQIEVIHIHDMVIAESVFRANKELHKTVVLDLHENRPEIMRFYGHVNTLKGKLLINLNKWRRKQEELISRADKIVVVTEEAKAELLTYRSKDPQDVVVLPNTIHPEIYGQYKIDNKITQRLKDKFVVLYLGDTSLRRGTDTAIKAIKHLGNQIDNIRLVMVGNNKAEDKKLHALANEMGVADRVIFEGWQDVSLFPSYVEAAAVCISPLKRNLHHDTTFANKIFQYMSMGKPLIVSDSTAQANVIKETSSGLIFTAEKETELADKILYVYQHPEQAKKMGENGSMAVKERWNWLETSKDFINLYRELSTSE